MTQRWISTSAAAERLGVSIHTVYRLGKANRLAFRRDEDTGTWRFDAVSVDAYIRSRTVPVRVMTPAIESVALRLPRQVAPWQLHERRKEASR